MWADSAEVVHRVVNLANFPPDKLLKFQDSGFRHTSCSRVDAVVDPACEIAADLFPFCLGP